MNPLDRGYGEYYRYVHTWPGQVRNKSTGKHKRARKARFLARTG